MFDPVVFAPPFLILAAAAASGCAFDPSFDAAFDICADTATGHVSLRPQIIRRLPSEDPDELLALI